MLSGFTTVQRVGGKITTVSIPFGKTFSGVPVVTMTYSTDGPNTVAVSIKSRHADHFEIYLYSKESSSPMSLQWIAVL